MKRSVFPPSTYCSATFFVARVRPTAAPGKHSRVLPAPGALRLPGLRGLVGMPLRSAGSATSRKLRATPELRAIATIVSSHHARAALRTTRHLRGRRWQRRWVAVRSIRGSPHGANHREQGCAVDQLDRLATRKAGCVRGEAAARGDDDLVGVVMRQQPVHLAHHVHRHALAPPLLALDQRAATIAKRGQRTFPARCLRPQRNSNGNVL